MQNVLQVCGSFWMPTCQSSGFSDWLRGVIGAKGLLLESSLPIYLHWLRMMQKHVLNSYMSLELWIPLLEGNTSNGFHSCFWGEWHLFQVYLVGSLIPSLNHCQPSVHFTGMWLSQNDIMCLDTSSFRGWWAHGVWFKNHFFIFTWWL